MPRAKTQLVDEADFTARDLSELKASYQADLVQQARAADATIHAEAAGNVEKERSLNGVGARVLSVPTLVAAKARLEGETFEDPGYRRHIAKRYPGTEVRAGGTRIQSGWSPSFEANAPAFLRKRF